MSRKKINLEDAIDFITGGDLSDLSGLHEESDFGVTSYSFHG